MNTLILNDNPLLTEMPDTATTELDAHEIGQFLRVRTDPAASRFVQPLGRLTGVSRFTCLHRYEPFWMTAKTGTRANEIPPETQFLMGERESGDYVLLVPLPVAPMRCSLQGGEDDRLEIVAESGNPAVVADNALALFVTAGDDPYELIARSAESVAQKLGARLRREKSLPDFIENFGWCTWDAFYHDVSHDKVREGLESFRAGGVEPKFLILDDGWQSVREMPTGEKRVTDFRANDKFPGDLVPTVEMAKREFGIETFLVWHAVQGYWGGVDDESLPGYGVRSIARRSSEGIRHHQPGVDSWWGPVVGAVPPDNLYRFYQDYHRHLRTQGVDGVKVDTQAVLESLAHGLDTDRVSLMQCCHEALEGATNVHFDGNLINCMSCASEMLYYANASNLTRTSTDFWPKRPETHGQHLYVNAFVSLWFGEFIRPDWDMFQSGHEMGAYHAAGRALSGGPVYVSDKPREQNVDLLRKLVLPDGSVPRGDQIGRPTRDCLFHDPTKEDVLLKIFNGYGYDRFAIGCFHAHYQPENSSPITGDIGPDDIPNRELGGHEEFAFWAVRAQQLFTLKRGERHPVTVAPQDWEIFVFSPIRDGVSTLGLCDMLNGFAVSQAHFVSDDPEVIRIEVYNPGRHLFYLERVPQSVTDSAGDSLDFSFDNETGGLFVDVPSERAEGGVELHIRLTGNGG